MAKVNAMDVGTKPVEDNRTMPTAGGTVVPRAPQQPVIFGELSGAFDPSKMKIPYLALVHGVGTLVTKFDMGTLVLGDEVQLTDKIGDPLTVVVLQAQDFYKERLTQEQRQAKVVPKTFPDKASAAAAGMIVDWITDPETGRSVGPQVSPAMNMGLLIQKPEKIDSGHFAIEIAGKTWAMAKFSVDKDAYSAAASPVWTARMAGKLRAPKTLVHGSWTLKTEWLPKRSGNKVLVPKMYFSPTLNDDSFVEAVAKTFGHAPAAAAE